jgi:hypothetical protein
VAFTWCAISRVWVEGPCAFYPSWAAQSRPFPVGSHIKASRLGPVLSLRKTVTLETGQKGLSRLLHTYRVPGAPPVHLNPVITPGGGTIGCFRSDEKQTQRSREAAWSHPVQRVTVDSGPHPGPADAGELMVFRVFFCAGDEPGALCVLAKCCTTEPHPRPLVF